MLVSSINAAPLDQITNQPATTTQKVAVRSIEDMITESAHKNGVEPSLALKIAECESHYRQFNEKTGEVLRGEDNPQDVGVFQINEKYHLGRSQSKGFDIYTAQGNINYAVYLLKTEGSKPWVWSKGCWRTTQEQLALNS